MSSFRVAVLPLALVMSLSACLQGPSSSGGTTIAQRGGEVMERDVEAPEIFSKQDNGLWDGRPSLGGVWVAHPDVSAPERVIIRNTVSGRETVGALFKRERMNPGPVFQVSAEAANAIGMLAGAPTALEVVALRTEEVSTAPQALPEQALPEAAPDLPPAPEAQAAPEAPVAQAPASAAAPDMPDAEATLIALPQAEAPRRRGLLSRLFGGSDTPEPEITSAPLDDSAPAQDEAPVAVGTPLPMPTPLANTASALQASPPAASSLDRPYVQIGIFSVEANANGAAAAMRRAGLTATIRAGQTQGNAFWRVVVGPAATEAERRQILAQVRELGFADAYAVRR